MKNITNIAAKADKSKHNWSLVGKAVRGYTEAGSPCTIATIFSNGPIEGSVKDSANLIVAAPDLLAACKNLLWKANQRRALSNDDINQASAAIAKAERGAL